MKVENTTQTVALCRSIRVLLQRDTCEDWPIREVLFQS